MYANQVCSRIRRAFCKRTRLNPQENHFNGVYNALGGVRPDRSNDCRSHRSPQIQRIDFFRWTPRLNRFIVIQVRALPSGGFVELDVCVQPCSLRCKSADLVALPLNLSPRHFSFTVAVCFSDQEQEIL
jgi:hypothetical protein